MPDSFVPASPDTCPETKKKEWVTPQIHDQTIQSLTENGSKIFFSSEASTSTGPAS